MKTFLQFILAILVFVGGIYQIVSSNANLEEIMPFLAVLAAYLLFVAFAKPSDKSKLDERK